MENYIEELDKFPESKTSFTELEMNLRESKDTTPEQRKVLEFEKLALAFSIDHDTGAYYGPKMSGKRKDGTDFEFPHKSMVSKEALDYWRRRSQLRGRLQMDKGRGSLTRRSV